MPSPDEESVCTKAWSSSGVCGLNVFPQHTCYRRSHDTSPHMCGCGAKLAMDPRPKSDASVAHLMTVAAIINDLSWQGKQVPIGHAGAIAAVLDRRGLLAEEPGSVMLICPDCGNKRCPRAADKDRACTGSNEVGQ